MNSMDQGSNSRNAKVTLKCSFIASPNNQIQESVWIKEETESEQSLFSTK